MRTVVGIDEAGYGPTLGPLVLGWTVFEVEEGGHPGLYGRLQGVLSRDARPGSDRLAVDDSKRLYGSGRSLAALELAALAFLQIRGGAPRRLEQLLERDPEPTWPRWYTEAGEARELPREVEPAAVESWRRRLAEDLPARGVRLRTCRAIPVLAGPFNRSLDHTGNKAASLLEFLTPLLRRSLEEARSEEVRIDVDRLGGRRYYERFLGSLFPMAPIRTVRERPESSVYEVRAAGRQLRISFETQADARHLHVALASVCAKYLRELFVRRLNQHFVRQRPGLRPTAGYPQDAGRFLAEIADLYRAEDRLQLIRQA